MARINWNASGQRLFEAGVDRGVLYLEDGSGVPWNGLLSVSENPTGHSVKAYYLDGVKYLNVAGRKEYGGTIEAYTYPEEFNQFDGWWALESGLGMDEQPRKAFDFTYRTGIGNDIDGANHGYKIHIVYGALATPSSRKYGSINDRVNPLTFVWDFTTTPQRVISQNVQLPLSHVTIDSRKTNPTQLRLIEAMLYGTDLDNAKLPPLQDILALFENPTDTLLIEANFTTGRSILRESTSIYGDLRGRLLDGLYEIVDQSRLIETATPGLHILEL